MDFVIHPMYSILIDGGDSRQRTELHKYVQTNKFLLKYFQIQTVNNKPLSIQGNTREEKTTSQITSYKQSQNQKLKMGNENSLPMDNTAFDAEEIKRLGELSVARGALHTII